MNPHSLTFRLVAWYCALLCVIGASFSAFTYAGFGYYLDSTMRTQLVTRATDMGALATPLLDNPAALSTAMARRFSPEAHDRFMRLRVDGETRYRSGQPVSREYDAGTIDANLDRGKSLQSRGNLWIYTVDSNLPGGHVLTIESGQLDVDMQEARRGLVRTLLIALPILLVIAAGGGYWLVRRALRPVSSMINAAEAMTFNTPEKRLPLAGTADVFDDFVKTLNRMLDRLDHAYQHANRFSADAAHEIRTPLAILRGELEYIAPRTDLPPEISAAATSALDETVRLSQLVENLMNLAVIEGTGGKRVHHSVDLRDLSREIIDQMQLLAVEKSTTLTCTDGPPVVVPGDRDRLKQAIVNLIDNAIKYTPGGGTVTIDVTAGGQSATLTVADTGIGIDADHQTRIFERFFRVAPDRGSGGAGLGLSIIKSIVLAHGGSVAVQSARARGSTFVVSLPMSPVTR